MNPLALISKKADMVGQIIKIMHPDFTDKEVIQKSKQYMQRPLIDIQIWYSALTKSKKCPKHHEKNP